MAPVAEARFACNHLQRMAAALDHQTRRLHAQTLYRLGRRLAGLGREHTAELARAEVRSRSEFFHAQRLRQVAACMLQRPRDAVRSRREIQDLRMLRLAARTALV